MNSRLWRFIGIVYWQTNLDLIPKQLSTLMAGNLLGPAADSPLTTRRTALAPCRAVRTRVRPLSTSLAHSDQAPSRSHR